MSVESQMSRQEASDDPRLRRALVLTAGIVTVAAALHLVDHAIRGELVDAHGLISDWNHSGWPFREHVTPYTASLAIPVVFVVGIVLTMRGRLWARFWLCWASVAAAVVLVVHFVPGPSTETMVVIYRSYVRSGVSPLAGVVALLIVGVILVGLAVLISLAVWARRAPMEH